MIDIVQKSNIYKPNFHINRNDIKSHMNIMVNQVDVVTGFMGPRNMVISSGIKAIHDAMASVNLISDDKVWSKKVEKIKNAVVSGRYKIDAEKLAEKMLSAVVGGFM